MSEVLVPNAVMRPYGEGAGRLKGFLGAATGLPYAVHESCVPCPLRVVTRLDIVGCAVHTAQRRAAHRGGKGALAEEAVAGIELA